MDVMMDSEAGGVDRAMLVDCLGAGGGPSETLVEKRLKRGRMSEVSG